MKVYIRGEQRMEEPFDEWILENPVCLEELGWVLTEEDEVIEEEDVAAYDDDAATQEPEEAVQTVQEPVEETITVGGKRYTLAQLKEML